MIKVKLGLNSFYLPTKWEGLKGSQVLPITRYLLQDTPENRIGIIKAFMPESTRQLFPLMSAEQLYEITRHVSWMYTQPMNMPFFECVKLNDKDYCLPKGVLDTTTLLEYAYAVTYFEAVKNGDLSKLPYLTATLVREKRTDMEPEDIDYDGDTRKPFNPAHIEARAKKMLNASIEFQLFVLIYFSACQKTLKEKYATSGFFNEGEASANTAGFAGLIWDLANGLVNEKAIAEKNIHHVMAYASHIAAKTAQRNAVPESV
jgi:hypothetical protein